MLSSALLLRFPKYLFGKQSGGFAVEHVVLSRAGIRSNLDQFPRKLHKLSQLLVHVMVNRQSYDLT